MSYISNIKSLEPSVQLMKKFLFYFLNRSKILSELVFVFQRFISIRGINIQRLLQSSFILKSLWVYLAVRLKIHPLPHNLFLLLFTETLHTLSERLDQNRHGLLIKIGSVAQLVDVVCEFRRDPFHVVGFEILFWRGRGGGLQARLIQTYPYSAQRRGSVVEEM